MSSMKAIQVSQAGGAFELVETFPLERADEAYNRMMSNQVRFKAVLVP